MTCMHTAIQTVWYEASVAWFCMLKYLPCADITIATDHLVLGLKLKPKVAAVRDLNYVGVLTAYAWSKQQRSHGWFPC
jgi:hypothetical protein